MPAASHFSYVIVIRSTPHKIWNALFDPVITRQYWVDTHQISDWKVGSSWKIMIPDGRVADSGEVLEIDEPRKLVLKWRNEFQPHLLAEGYSRCTIELTLMGSSVQLRVTHEMDRPDSKLIEGVAGGWPLILSSLKTLLETGTLIEETRHWPKGI